MNHNIRIIIQRGIFYDLVLETIQGECVDNIMALSNEVMNGKLTAKIDPTVENSVKLLSGEWYKVILILHF